MINYKFLPCYFFELYTVRIHYCTVHIQYTLYTVKTSPHQNSYVTLNISFSCKSLFLTFLLCRFSVDFSAHISYHYLDSEGGPDERVKSSLYGLGLPIIQGAISTILGVIGGYCTIQAAISTILGVIGGYYSGGHLHHPRGHRWVLYRGPSPPSSGS